MENSLQKFEKIISWYDQVCEEPVRTLIIQEKFGLKSEVERLIGEPFPKDISDLYQRYDGENKQGLGSFLGHSFINLEQIIQGVKEFQTFTKPINPRIPDPVKADELINAIVNIGKEYVPQKMWFGILKKGWHKIEFECSPNSLSGPYFYPTVETNIKNREVLEFSVNSQEKLWELTRKLHNLEKESYNWDRLKFVVYGKGQIEFDREFYNFDEELPLTSTPPDYIKKKYFHFKWLPILRDGCGNYIGIDLDPDKNGDKGQVIVFGPDEDDRFVVSKSWDGFLDLLLSIIEEGGSDFVSQCHIHDVLKERLHASLV